ncbi:right-handed parallel beta-helix repeat-containing protein [Isosphaeraceae bacterium EP7]
MRIDDANYSGRRLSKDLARSARRTTLRPRLRTIEVLEDRQLLSTFTVSNLNASGAGSLRRAIVDSNARLGADTIDFQVNGTIKTGHVSLPSITDALTIDGSTAPSFAGSPVVTVDFQGSKGLKFDRGADGSTLKSLSLVKAGNAGVTLNASRITVAGNYIGLRADGRTSAGNRGDGLQINASSHGNLIGNANPVSGVTFYNSDQVTTQPVSYWQGIRGGDVAGQYLISGTSNTTGLLFVGNIEGVGTSYPVQVPFSTVTSAYGPDNLGNGRVRVVGSYQTNIPSPDSAVVHGFLFEGTTAELTAGTGNYRTIDYPGSKFNFVHSTMGGLAVGNSDAPTSSGQPLGPGQAYVYDLASGTFAASVVYPGSTSNTAYGIWSNGGTKYTICGGYSNLSVNNLDGQRRPIGEAYLVDYDSATGQFSNWKTFEYPNGVVGTDYIAHFEGISSVEKGVYTLSADSVQTTGGTGLVQGSLVTVRRNTDGSFGDAVWVNLQSPGDKGIPSANSVYGNQVVGIITDSSGESAFQATVNSEFQLSNVIAGNGGNGIGVYGSDANVIAMNYIGTDATGTLKRGNAKNGILLTKGAARNVIGGQATAGNDPTAGVFARPPQGNLVSGNGGNGVLINDGSHENLLSGNFVGTTASGNAALGNKLDGVAIENADANSLIGCTFSQDPFVFYNVLSGNGGNGLRITNSNNTMVQANFMGVGANNASIVANGGNGLLISGSSRNTQVGGVIPLGNVISGNNRNGIEVRDTASGFISFNTFGGVYAFGGAAPNRGNGILITSSGGNNQVRTSIISGNRGNGIELGGNATGVQIYDVAAGTNTNITVAIPNAGSGIKLSGRAHHNVIGGFQPSVVPQVTLSANGRYGVEVTGSARNNAIFHTFVGTNFHGAGDLGNTLGGIYLGSGTSSTTIGGPGALQNRIENSGGNGLTIQSSSSNTVLANLIRKNGGDGVVVAGHSAGTRVLGNEIGDNAGNGVTLAAARKVNIGGSVPGSGNQIVGNRRYGLLAFGNNHGTVVQRNVIAANASGNVNLTKASGITYIPA